MRKPLQWQTKNLDKFKSLFLRDTYTLIAGTGTGKTWATTMCLQHALAKNPNLYFVVACPSRSIKSSWYDQLIQAGIPVTEKEAIHDPSISGCVITYAAMKHCANLLQTFLSSYSREFYFVFDEFHHLEDNSSWASPFKNFGLQPSKVMLLSGTPWREKGDLPWANYNAKDCVVSDFTWTYGEDVSAIPDEERNTVELLFDHTSGYAECERVFPDRYEVDGTVYRETETYHTERLQTNDSLTPFTMFNVQNVSNMEVATKLLAKANKCLETERKNYHYAGGLAIVRGRDEAEAVSWYLTEVLGVPDRAVVVVTSDDPKSHDKIHDFDEDTSKQWLVAINMVSEGVDVPRLKVIADLSDKKTLMHIIQRWGRAVRRVRSKTFTFLPTNAASVFIIDHPKLRDTAEKILEDIRLNRQSIVPSDPGESPARSQLVVKETIVDGESCTVNGTQLDVDTVELARWVWSTDFRNVKKSYRSIVDVLPIAELLIDGNMVPVEFTESLLPPVKSVAQPSPDVQRAFLVKSHVRIRNRLAEILGSKENPDFIAANQAINIKTGFQGKWVSAKQPLGKLRERCKAASQLIGEVWDDAPL